MAEPSAEGQVRETPFKVVAPEIDAPPKTSKSVSKDEVLIPTRLVVVSILKTLVSTVRLEDRVREERVLEPETERVSETRLSEFRVKAPIPVVLVGGSWRMVGTCLEKVSKFELKALTLCSKAARSRTRSVRVREEAETGWMMLWMMVGGF